MMRLILYTGKGGVGKSSIAAATAVRAAELGRRTLLVSSDLAHNLSDIFDVRVGAEPTQVADNLFALEVDALQEIREHWNQAQEYFTGMLSYLGVDDAIAEEVALYPGLDDIFILSRILLELESDRYDSVIMDCSPTAGTLRHLTLSDAACTKLNKLIDVERKILKLIRPFVKTMKNVRDFIPEDDVYLLFEDLLGKVGQLGEILKDPEVSSIRLVLNPDRIAIAETRRAFTYFGLFGFPIDGIFVNKILPNALSEGYLHDWYTLQQQHLESISQSFLDVTQLKVPLLDREPIGLDSMSEMARGIFADQNPVAILCQSKPASMTRADGKYQISFQLPSIERSQLDIGQKGADLIITAGAHTRVFSLPDTMADLEVAGAKYADGALTIRFN